MDVVLCYKQSSLLFNISPYMPILYIRKLANKTFKIPQFALNLIYDGMKINNKDNEKTLKEYFGNISSIIINIGENESQLNFKSLLSKTTKSIIKDNLIKNTDIIYNKEIKFNIAQTIKKRNKSDFLIGQNNTISFFEKDNCQECLKNSILFYCRDDNSFLCQNCKEKKHKNHLNLFIDKNNITQCFYIYQKQLIDKIKEQEELIYNLSYKEKIHEDKTKLEELINLLQKIYDKEQKILNCYPTVSIEYFLEKDYTEIKRNIFDLNNELNFNNCYSYKDKLQAFQTLNKKDLELRDYQKEINEINTKILFSEIIKKIIEKITNDLIKLYNDMKKILEDNTINPINITFDFKQFINKQSEIFEIEINENQLKNKEENYEEYFLKKSSKHNRAITENDLGNKINILPFLKVNSSNNLKENENHSSKNLKNDIYKLDIKSDFSDSSDKKNYSNNKEKYFDSNSGGNTHNNQNNNNNNDDDYSIKNKKSFNLNDLLLNSDGSYDKLYSKKKSIKLSVFIKNKTQIKTPIEIMKKKKKKKKIDIKQHK